MAESSTVDVFGEMNRGSGSARGDGDMAPNAGPAYAVSAAALTRTSRGTGDDDACPCRAAPWLVVLEAGRGDRLEPAWAWALWRTRERQSCGRSTSVPMAGDRGDGRLIRSTDELGARASSFPLAGAARVRRCYV